MSDRTASTTRTFADQLRKHPRQVPLSLLFVFAWVAAADGKLPASERQLLTDIGQRHGIQDAIEQILQTAQSCRAVDIQLALEILGTLEREHRYLALLMAIGVALADGYLVTAENHALRLISDAIGLGLPDLEAAFHEATGSRLPYPGDQSDPGWWRHQSQSRERRSTDADSGGPHTRTNRERSSRTTSRSGPDLQRLRDLAQLGLDETATRNDIINAYRRMAKVHHPDKFTSLGPEAVEHAEAAFQRIHSAYERLVQT